MKLTAPHIGVSYISRLRRSTLSLLDFLRGDRDLAVDGRDFTKEFEMLSFATLQAIAQSQIKQKPASTSNGTSNPPSRKPVLRRFFDALFEVRTRRAEIEVEHHRRFYDGHPK
jgi:hypothetical protein